MATATTVPRHFEVLQDRSLDVVDLAAITVAARAFEKRKGELSIGEHGVYLKCVISGGVSLGAPVHSSSPADTVSVLAWVLSRLRPEQLATVRAAVAEDGFLYSVTEDQKAVAKSVCEPTKRPTVRSGSLTGVVSVDCVR